MKLEWDHGRALAGAVKRLNARCSVGDMASAMASVLSRPRLGERMLATSAVPQPLHDYAAKENHHPRASALSTPGQRSDESLAEKQEVPAVAVYDINRLCI